MHTSEKLEAWSKYSGIQTLLTRMSPSSSVDKLPILDLVLDILKSLKKVVERKDDHSKCSDGHT